MNTVFIFTSEKRVSYPQVCLIAKRLKISIIEKIMKFLLQFIDVLPIKILNSRFDYQHEFLSFRASVIGAFFSRVGCKGVIELIDWWHIRRLARFQLIDAPKHRIIEFRQSLQVSFKKMCENSKKIQSKQETNN
jgi:hypothetical protein